MVVHTIGIVCSRKKFVSPFFPSLQDPNFFREHTVPQGGHVDNSSWTNLSCTNSFPDNWSSFYKPKIMVVAYSTEGGGRRPSQPVAFFLSGGGQERGKGVEAAVFGPEENSSWSSNRLILFCPQRRATKVKIRVRRPPSSAVARPHSCKGWTDEKIRPISAPFAVREPTGGGSTHSMLWLT